MRTVETSTDDVSFLTPELQNPSKAKYAMDEKMCIRRCFNFLIDLTTHTTGVVVSHSSSRGLCVKYRSPLYRRNAFLVDLALNNC